MATLTATRCNRIIRTFEILAGSDSLGAGDLGVVEVDVRVTPGTQLGPYDNMAVAFGTSAGGIVIQDTSTNGTVADANGNGDPGDDQTATSVSFRETPLIGLAKAVQQQPLENADGTWSVRYLLVVRNMGDVPVHRLQVTDDLATVFDGTVGFRIDAVSSPEFSVNAGFDGVSDHNLLAGTDSLVACAGGTIALELIITHARHSSPCLNSAMACAMSPAQRVVTDASTAGLHPDPDGNGNPADNQEPTALRLR